MVRCCDPCKTFGEKSVVLVSPPSHDDLAIDAICEPCNVFGDQNGYQRLVDNDKHREMQ